MSNIGQRIKNVIFKRKSFWNWKNENDISVNIPEPNDYRVKISYDTNVELVFNREVIFSATYPKKEDVPRLRDIIPTGYKLLYPNSEISVYNNNRFVVVYDYYVVNVHYREESDINKDISVFTGRFQYGALITKDIINWPSGHSSKQPWIEFVTGELTPARVIDKYVYLNKEIQGGSNTWGEKPSNMENNTTIDAVLGKIKSTITLPPGYYDPDELKKIINGRLPYGVLKEDLVYSNINKGYINNVEIKGTVPNTLHSKLDDDPLHVIKKKNNPAFWNYAMIFFYDKHNDLFKDLTDSDYTKHSIPVRRMAPILYEKYPTNYDPVPHNVNNPEGLLKNLVNQYIVVELDGVPFIGTVTFLDTKRKHECNIGNLLSKLENEPGPYQNYYKSHLFYIDDLDDHIIDMVATEVVINGKSAELPFIAFPMESLKTVGLYTYSNSKMYRHYFRATNNAKISNDIIKCIPTITDDGTNIKYQKSPLRFRVIDDPTNKTDLNDYKSHFGPYIDITNDPVLKVNNSNIHKHKLSDVKATLMKNEQSYLIDYTLDETAIYLETKAAGGGSSGGEDPAYKKQKYRIHYFDENGTEMKEYLTDQYIKDGEPPSLYPPKKYDLDPNKPWTRNPKDLHEIYVYLVKKKCKVIIKLRVSNPNNIHNKYWDPLSNTDIDIYSETILVDTRVELNKYNKMIINKYNDHMDFVSFTNVTIGTIEYTKLETLVAIEDNTTIMFNYKISKSSSTTSVIKLSDARKEFGIINEYFDYSFAAVIIPKELLYDREVFSKELKERSKKLVEYKKDLSDLHRDPTSGSLINHIIYDVDMYRNFPINSYKALAITVYTVIDGIRSQKWTGNMNLSDFLASSGVINNVFDKGNSINAKYQCCSNLSVFFIEDHNNVQAKDMFNILFANSPEFIDKNIDIEIEIEWSDFMLNFIYKDKYSIDFRFIPTVLLPDNTNYSINNSNFDIPIINELRLDNSVSMSNNYNLYQANMFASDEIITQNKANSNTFMYHNMNADYLESIKVTNLTTFLGTSGFKLRPWSIRQILARPIPLIHLDTHHTANLIDYRDIHHTFTQINDDKSDKLYNKVLSNSFYHNYSDSNDEINDSNVILTQFSHVSSSIEKTYFYWIMNTAYCIDSPEMKHVVLFPTTCDDFGASADYINYGARSIKDWFKIAINIFNMRPDKVRMYQLEDVYYKKSISHNLYSDIQEVITDPKPYKVVNFSHVTQDIYHDYINKDVGPSDKPRHIFLPTIFNNSNDTTDLKNENNIVRNYDENGITPAVYVSKNTQFAIKTNLKTAYKGYLNNKHMFSEHVYDEVIHTITRLNKKTEFYIISGGMFDNQAQALAANPSESKPTLGSLYDHWSKSHLYKRLIETDNMIDYSGEKLVFDENSVIKLIYSGENYYDITDIRHIKWHLIDKKHPTIVLDFERKYMLHFATPYSKSIIIPNLAEIVDYRCINNDINLNISDSAIWMEPVLSAFIDNNPKAIDTNVIRGDDISKIIVSDDLNSTSSIQGMTSIHLDQKSSASKYYYALIMHDIYNSKKDDGHSIRQELYDDKEFVKHIYKRYPNDNSIDKFVNIHMYNNMIKTADGEELFELKASRYDFRYHPFSIHCKFLGYNMYDLLFKSTVMFDFHSNERPYREKPNDDYWEYDKSRAVYRLKYDKSYEDTYHKRFAYSINNKWEVAADMFTSSSSEFNPNHYDLTMICPNIMSNYTSANNSRLSVGAIARHGSFYSPVCFEHDTINGLNYKDGTFTVSEYTYLASNSYPQIYTIWNPYAIVEKTDGNISGVHFEDIFKHAWDPYNGHRLNGPTAFLNDLKDTYVTNEFHHYADPLNISTNWILRVSRNMKHFGGAWSDNNMTDNKFKIYDNLNLIEQGIPQDAISWGKERYKADLNITDERILNDFEKKGRAMCFHPLDLKYICHPFQRVCLLLIRLVNPDTDAFENYNKNLNSYFMPVYLGYFHIRYEELESRKNDINSIKNYIKQCILRDDSGYKYYLKNFRYPYIFNTASKKLYKIDIDTDIPLDIKLVYTEDHISENPHYQFYVDLALKANIIEEDVYKPENEFICNTKAIKNNGSNAIINYMRNMKTAGTIKNKLGNNNISHEEFYDAINYLSTHSLEKIPASNNWNIPDYFVHKYSIFNGVKRFGWSAYNGQHLPKWPSVIPDNLTLLVSQNALQISNAVNKMIYYDNSNIGHQIFLNTNIMIHPNFIGGIYDRKNKYEQFDSTKFYGSINIVEAENDDYTPNQIYYDKKFEYCSNKLWDIRMIDSSKLSGMANFASYISYLIDDVSNNQFKWFKKFAYSPVHNVFMHASDYNKSVIYEHDPSKTIKDMLKLSYESSYPVQPMLKEDGVSNYNVWDDETSIGFRMDLNPCAVNIMYKRVRFTPSAIQWNLTVIYRRDNSTDFFQQKHFWTGIKNYNIHEIEFNPDPNISEYMKYKDYTK